MPIIGEPVTRRAVLVGACVTCAAAVAGCGSAAPAPAKGTQLATTADIPVGGGEVFPDAKIVVTQPKAGTFAAFSAVCTHAGCTVGEVADGTINCPCHGSMYAIADGSVVKGPATRPLAAAQIAVKGTAITLA